jgi:AcrR family transcriptional regulator
LPTADDARYTGQMPKAIAQARARSAQPGRGTGPGTRESLLAATATAIARSGWSAVTTRQVAALAHVNPALVHYHFGSMDELRREAVLAAMAAEIERPMGALLADLPLPDAIAACVDAVAQIDPDSDRFALLFEAMLEGGRDASIRAVLTQAYDRFRTALAGRIRDAGGREPEAAAVVIAAALDGVLLHRMVKPDLDLVGLTATLVAALQIPQARPGRRVVRVGNARGAAGGGVRLVLVLGDRFTGYSPGAMKEDAGLVSHAKAWKRTAVVSDLGWVAHLSTAFGWMVPGKFKHFGLADRDAAIAWVARAE